MANIGDTFDEDIDVKIIIKKNHVCKIKDIAIPESNIIEEILKMRFLEYAYQIDSNDVVVEYTGYPLQTPSMPLITENPFNRPSAQEEYNRNKEEYIKNLNRIFCYEYYEKKMLIF